MLKESTIQQHPIWHGPNFWERCLLEKIYGEISTYLPTPVLWDELSPEMLRETVISIHNIVFGQLGTIAFSMHEIGLDFETV